MDISGTTAMITGGARIGRAAALKLAHSGAINFVMTYNRSRGAIEETALMLAARGARAMVFQMDATSEADVKQTVAAALAAFGKIDILVNMASIFQSRPIENLSLEDWRADIDSNATSAMLSMQAVAPIMAKCGNGRIINFADWTAASRRVAYRAYAAYYAAKHAVIGLTEAFALEYAPNVLINCIAPGPILPPSDLPAEEVEETANETPLRRWGGSEEIAEAVEFLVRTNFITGECLRVDGGRHLL